MGQKKREAKDAVCPFYHRENSEKIFCEGLSKETAIQLTFNTVRALKAHRSVFCCGFDFLRCPIAKMLWEVWEESEEEN